MNYFSNVIKITHIKIIGLLSCSLEIWYFMALVLFAGYLEDAEVSIDALSIWYVLVVKLLLIME